MDVVAKGARKSGSRLAGSSEPLSVSRMTLAQGRVRSYITSVQPLMSFPVLRSDYARLMHALAFTELAAGIATDPSIAEPLFKHAVTTLRLFETHEHPLVVSIWSHLVLLDLEGVLPSFDRCVVTGEVLSENPALVSLAGGGYVRRGHAAEFMDTIPAQAEVLLALAKTVELDQPPPRIKLSIPTFRLLARFDEEAAHGSLPALRRLVQELDHLDDGPV